MTIWLYAACLSFAVIMGVGQLLFKFAAQDIRIRAEVSLVSAAFSPWLIAAIFLYAAGTVLWIGILMYVPLNKAYPFALLGAALVPILAVLALGEALSIYYPLGLGVVVIGIMITQIG
jgi:drug/metabolite transporter (DMT)-like permease